MFVRASIENLEQIIEIERQSFDKPWTENHFRTDIKKSSSYNRVYLKNKRVVAYLFGFCVLDEFHLNNIAVCEKYRNKGIGTILIKNLLFYLQCKKVKSVYLEVSESNLFACNLYEKIGFVAQGRRKDYYAKGDDAILYTLELLWLNGLEENQKK